MMMGVSCDLPLMPYFPYSLLDPLSVKSKLAADFALNGHKMS
jgi:hypothetical protein